MNNQISMTLNAVEQATNMPTQQPEWVKEFDEKFCFHDTKYDCFAYEDQKPSEIKSFITQLLDAEKKRIVEGLMEMIKNTNK